ncbi:MAG TPA: hypothetical protein VKE40_26050 [Gemmataceae bacterium]|nr:hypothetical protein [Gemmataceae bacterium]
MAILGIVVMFTFVLSSGAVGSGNDFFDQIGSIFGTKGRGEVLAVAYGDKIRDTDLAELRLQRRAAHDFLELAIESSYTNWARSLKADLDGSRLSFDTKTALGRFVNLRVNFATDPQAYRRFLNGLVPNQFSQGSPDLQQFFLARSRAKPGSEDQRALDAAATILQHDLGLTPLLLTPELGWRPEERDQDDSILNFALLLKKADRVGINYSADGIREEVARLTQGRLSKTDNAEIEQTMRKSGRYGAGNRGGTGEFTSDWLMNAVGNEFRARDTLATMQGSSLLAEIIRKQSAAQMQIAFLLGIDPEKGSLPGQAATLSAPPGAVTPYQFWEFYKDRCTENNFTVLEVPAEAFLDQVKEEPTSKQREDLFKKYRGDLPDPARDTPGFKEPRKVKVEFITLDAKTDRVTKAIPAVHAASVFLSASGGALSTNAVSAGALAAHPADAHPAIGSDLVIREKVREKQEANFSRYMGSEQFYFTPRDTSIFRPRPIVSALGMLAGNPDVTTFAGAAASVHQNVEMIDHQTRIPILVQPLLTPFNPTIGNALGTPALAYALNPKLPPEGLYIKAATEAARTEQRHLLFQADVKAFEDKLRELMKDARPMSMLGQKLDKDKAEKARAETRKYVDQWLKDRGLTAAGTKDPADRFQIVTDPGLKPLNDLAKNEPDGTNSLSQKLFDSWDPRQLGIPGLTGGPEFNVKPFEPFWFPEDPMGDGLDKPNHFVWESEEVEPRTYNNLENADKILNGEMTKRVVRAWKVEKARALARADADRLAEEVRQIGKTAATDPGGVERQLKDLAAQKNYRKFEIERLALLKFDHAATRAEQTYLPPKIDKNLVVYQTPNFASQLLDLRKQPVGAVTVLPDAPKRKFYVACLVGRMERKVEDFRDDVFTKSTAVGVARNPLYDIALQDSQGRATADVFKRLRAEARLEEMEAFKNREKREPE